MSNAENFAVQKTEADISELQKQPCCEKPQVGITWNAAMHERIVLKAVEALEGVKSDPRIGATVTAFLDAWPARRESALKALEDADDITKGYSSFLYSSHFYDPDTDASWWPGKHALSEAVRYSFEALWRIYLHPHGGPQSSQADIGYSIGLALHYVTDLIQPMHAANFIEVPLLDHRHSGFEAAADTWKFDGWTHVHPDDVDPSRWRSPAQIVSSVARQSKDVYRRTMKPILDRKWRGEEVPFSDFSDFEVQTIMDRVSEYAIKLVAAFLVQLQAVTIDDFVHRIFLRLLGHGAEHGMLSTVGLRLSEGMTTRQIVRSLVSGGEFYNLMSMVAHSNRSNWAEATRELYRRILVREPSDKDVQSWAEWMSAGRIVDSAQYMVDSSEYTNRFGAYEIPFPLA